MYPIPTERLLGCLVVTVFLKCFRERPNFLFKRVIKLTWVAISDLKIRFSWPGCHLNKAHMGDAQKYIG